MDSRRFDEISRRLGAAASRRSALAALAGMAAGLGTGLGAADDADARKRRRRRCNPACPTGQTCDTATRTCRCDTGGAVCGANCCRTGQTCQGGTCVDPLPQCLAFGATCKDTGVPCCGGLTCASGQGGQGDVACWVAKTGRCASTAECVYGTSCVDGICVAPLPPTPVPTVPPAPRCFPATADASANGAALQQAIRDATSGDTIRLAAGTYQFDDPSGVGVGSSVSGVGVEGKSLTIERCDAGAAVTLSCPNATNAYWACVLATGGEASLTLRGLSVEASALDTVLGWGVYAWSGASIVLEDVAVQVTGTKVSGIIVQGNTNANPPTGANATIRSGVSVNSTSATTEVKGLRQVDSSITCEAAVTFQGAFATDRCQTVTDSVCGCTG